MVVVSWQLAFGGSPTLLARFWREGGHKLESGGHRTVMAVTATMNEQGATVVLCREDRTVISCTP